MKVLYFYYWLAFYTLYSAPHLTFADKKNNTCIGCMASKNGGGLSIPLITGVCGALVFTMLIAVIVVLTLKKTCKYKW